MYNLKFILLICLLAPVTAIAQNPGKSTSILNSKLDQMDAQADSAIQKYRHGRKKEALATWQKIAASAPKTSSTYGTVLGNIMFYYREADNEPKMLEYYNLIMQSKLNDRDKRYDQPGEPYKNYRYNATMSLASYYAQKGELRKAMDYVHTADSKLTYENASLTAVIYQKVDLAFWKYKLYKDLGHPDSAYYVLLKRAFEYDYKHIYPNWATVSASNDEQELSQALITDTSKNAVLALKSEIDAALDGLKIVQNTTPAIVSFDLSGLNYVITVYEHYNTAAEYRNYLEQSYFYRYLADKAK